MAIQVDVVQESRRAWLPTAEWELLHKVYITEIDAYSRIDRLILKGIGSGYSFDMALWRKHLNVKWDVCVRMKSIDGKQIGQLRTASAP